MKHLETALAAKLDEPLSSVSQSDLARHLHARFAKVAADTVLKERSTISGLFKWAVAQGHLGQNPAADLPRLKGAAERPPFRTKAEIEAIIARGGLSAKELARIWEGLYLQPHEIAELLQLVRSRAKEDFEPLLHEIPAYTGMRRGEVRSTTLVRCRLRE